MPLALYLKHTIKAVPFIILFLVYMSFGHAFEIPLGFSLQDKSTGQIWFIAMISLIAMLISAVFLSHQIKKVSVKTNKMVGLVLLGFSSSLPLLVIASISGLSAKFDLMISNIISTNIANLTLVVGIIALIKPIEIKHGLGKGFLALIAICTGFLICILDVAILSGLSIVYDSSYIISFDEGVLVIALFIFYIILLRFIGGGEADDGPQDVSLMVAGINSVVLGIAVCYCANAAIKAFIELARIHNLPEMFIGSTLVVVGTSFPELAVALILLFEGKDDMIFNNLATSNVINLLVPVGIVALTTPIVVNASLLTFNLPFMIIVHIIALPLLIFGKISRLHAILLIGLFVLYIIANLSGGYQIIAGLA